jgi:peptidoglycan LD-endopeptidase LytH
VTRVGWVVLVGILLVAGLFACTLRIGGPAPQVQRAEVTAPPPPRGDGLPALIVPVADVGRAQIVDSWGDARSGGRGHKGTDIMAPGGTPVLAAADGVVEKLFESRLGGTTLYQRTADGRWTLYYAHLQGYAPGVREGLAVRAGQTIAFVGDTGDAGAGNHHLHFSLTRRGAGQRWWQGEDVNPYPALAGR